MLNALPSELSRDVVNEPMPRRKILIFEQNEYIASLLHLLLQREGFSISAITAIEDAQAHILSKSAPDLIFISNRWLLDDRPMILQAMENEEGWQNVSIIMMLDYFNIDVIEHALENGVCDYLVQPFEPGDLVDMIQRYISRD